MILEPIVINLFDPFLRICPFCGREFYADHMSRKFCPEFDGKPNFCKDNFHKPRMHEKLLFRNDVIRYLIALEILDSEYDHGAIQYFLTGCLESEFETVIPEYAIGGEFLKRIDLCVKQEKLKVGIEVKLMNELEGDYSQHVNGLLGQLSYYEIIFKNNLIVAYAGKLTHRSRTPFEKIKSLLYDRGISVVHIPENAD